MWYRLGQFWRLWRARPLSETARAEIGTVLSGPECELFSRFSWSDQQHSYRTFRILQSAGYTQPDLLAAALLHDIGKTRVHLSVWDRSLIVLGERIWPAKMAIWGQGNVQGWQRPFVVKQQHPAWGAELARSVGSRPLTVELIRRHQEALPETAVTEADRLLTLLQWADDQN